MRALWVLAFVATSAFVVNVASEPDAQDWWKTAQLYQIYPRSFKDSDGDGVGDIKGIIQNLGHLVDIDVNVTWLSPIFPSPMKDFGYDIKDFYNIAPEYGTIDDLVKLIEEAKKLGIKILLDFVPNHTSDECEWFKKSVNKEKGFENFYVWHPGHVDPQNPTVKPSPPSNWVSVFRNSAWSWNDIRKEYYLHQFLPEQPDLNYRDPAVVAEMKNVLTYWLSKGVAGFRIDAIPHLIEVAPNAAGDYLDEPASGLTEDKNSYDYLVHIYTREREETFDMVYQWRDVLDKFDKDHGTGPSIMLMEAMSDLSLVMQYYGNATHEGAHFPFNFGLAFLNKDSNAETVVEKIKNWMSAVPPNRVSNWVIGNHDQPRVATRFGPERSDGMVITNMLLPGISVTYQGEEIAMTNQYLSWEDTQDPQACNAGIDLFNITSRDPERTPFQWDDSENAGFSSSKKTWLPVADNYKTLNLKAQKAADRSPYKMYKALSALRQFDVIHKGDLVVKKITNEVYAFSRHESNDGSMIIVVVNTSGAPQLVNINPEFEDVPPLLDVIITSVSSKRKPGDAAISFSLELDPFEALVLGNPERFSKIYKM